jgi:hypothetical protein
MVSSSEDSIASINQLKAFHRHEPKILEGQILSSCAGRRILFG